jgi:hypothetical protein
MISLFKTVSSNENDPTWDRAYIVIAENGMLIEHSGNAINVKDLCN